MLCGETVAVCCENRTEHTDTLCGQSVPHRRHITSPLQETHHVSTTEPNRLMLCGETVAVCCENRKEHTDTLCGQSVPHRRHITSPLQSPTGGPVIPPRIGFPFRRPLWLTGLRRRHSNLPLHGKWSWICDRRSVGQYISVSDRPTHDQILHVL
jgi:hypothetical protein